MGRALTVAAPAGILIWLLTQGELAGVPLLTVISQFLQPLGNAMGLDGVILLSFILACPANELVLPLIATCYAANGALISMEGSELLYTLLINNGWSALTAFNTLLFSLFHWPCATTLITIWKETHSPYWTLLSFILPTAAGILLCLATKALLG